MKSWKKKIEEGRCQGYGSDYVPYLLANEARSTGTASMIYDPFEDRQIHTLSTTETNFYFNIRWDPELLHIREQYLLDTDRVNAIRQEKGLGCISSYYTTDFLLDYKDGTRHAFSIKYSAEEFNEEARQYKGAEEKRKALLIRQDVERIYWESQGVEFSIVTSEDVNLTLAVNVKSVMAYYRSFKVSNSVQKLKYLIAHGHIVVPMDKEYLNFKVLLEQFGIAAIEKKYKLVMIAEDEYDKWSKGKVIDTTAIEISSIPQKPEIAGSTEEKQLPQNVEKQDVSIRRGDLIADGNAKWRVIDYREGHVMIIRINKPKILRMPVMELFTKIEAGNYTKETETAVDKHPSLSSEDLESMKQKADVLEKVLDSLYPNWECIFKQRSSKECYEEAIEELGISRKHFIFLMKRYLVSGRDRYALIDRRRLNYGHTKILRIAECHGETYDINKLLKEALGHFKKNKSVQGAFDNIIRDYFRYPVEVDGVMKPVPYPLEEIPITYKMVYKYISTHLGGLTIQEYKDGERETRNNNRLLRGDIRWGVPTIGLLYEVDEVELPIQIVDPYTNKRIGKAIGYFAADVKTGTIVAASIGFDNNSCVGFNNLFMSILEPHNNQTTLVGINCTEHDYPSLTMPVEMRVDHGSEYESKALSRAMGELGISVDFVPVACGALKGLVENINNRVQIWLKTHLDEAGVVGNGYRATDKAQKEACLTLEDVRKLIYEEIMYINHHPVDDYSVDYEQLQADVVPSPSALYDFEVSRSGDPRNVTDANREYILFSLMARVDDKRKFSWSRKGIKYSRAPLWYYSEEPWFENMLLDETKDALKQIEVRYNDNSIGEVYIRYRNEIHAVPLAVKRESQASFAHLTWNEFDSAYKEYKKSDKRKEADFWSYAEKLWLIDTVEKTADIAKALTQAVDAKEIKRSRASAKLEQDQKPTETRNRMMKQLGKENKEGSPEELPVCDVSDMKAPAVVDAEAVSERHAGENKADADEGQAVNTTAGPENPDKAENDAEVSDKPEEEKTQIPAQRPDMRSRAERRRAAMSKVRY